MKKIFTSMLLLVAVATTAMAQDAAKTIVGVNNVPTTRVDLSQGLESGYYLLKQTNSNQDAAGGQGVGYIKAASEAADNSVTSKNTGTPGAYGATFVWYVEVIDAANNLITISTANKVAAWQAPQQHEKKLVAYDSRATLKYHTGTVNIDRDATPNEGSCFISNEGVTAFVHFSGDNLGSWTDTNSASMFMVEFYKLEEADLVTVPGRKISDFYEPTTDLGAYGDANISKIVNGNTGDYWWSDRAQAVDNTITVVLNNVHQVGTIIWYFCDGEDKPNGATIERKATADGEWIPVADFTIYDIKNNVFTCTANGNDVKELRLRITAENSKWLKVAEVELYEFVNVDKTELQELIVEAENLFDQISSSEKEKGDNEIELSGKISSNAGQNENNPDGDADGAGIAGLIDADPATYFHSRWGGTAINEDHYLQIDLGDGNKLSDFVFEYAVRKTENANNTSPAPTSIEVRVSEDGADFGDPIVTLTANDNNLPAYSDIGNTLWCSDVIKADINARYIRFTVTGSAGPGNNKWNNHYFFAMGTLNLYPTKDVKVIADNYKECIKEELFNAYVEAINEAKSVNESLEAMPNDVETAREELATQLAAIKAVLTHPLTVTAAGYATLYLGFDAAIPAGAEAYIVKQSGINEGYITMTQIKGTIPANTGVIVKANQGTYGFAYSAENKADVKDNLLEGSVVATEINVEAYVLGNVDGVGLYKAKMTDGKWLNNANKAYLPAIAVPNKSVAFYGFDWDGTTGIEQITENGVQSTEIYDLQGRRVSEITEKGIYIVGGKKVLVK